MHVVIWIHYVAACLLTAHVDDTDQERVGREIKKGANLEKLQKGLEKLYQKNIVLFNRDMFKQKNARVL